VPAIVAAEPLIFNARFSSQSGHRNYKYFSPGGYVRICGLPKLSGLSAHAESKVPGVVQPQSWQATLWNGHLQPLSRPCLLFGDVPCRQDRVFPNGNRLSRWFRLERVGLRGEAASPPQLHSN
jgi:hypothetical protein